MSSLSAMHKWWQNRPGENCWLEVTRRPDIGTNLKAPQKNEHGDDFWGYSLVRDVIEGDVVYHYDGIAQAIVARSRATGIVWEGNLTWAARGASARSANVAPHSRPGWYFGLEQYEKLPKAVTLGDVRAKKGAITVLRDSLSQEAGDPLYFPFEISSGRPIRPMQGYLFKLPRAFVDLFGIAIPDLPGLPLPVSSRKASFGEDYRTADESIVLGERDPFAVDPALVERGIRGHARTQNQLAAHLNTLHIEPRSPGADEPNFDIAWRGTGGDFVAEVKSITDQNEEKQLRLGLGQVLRFASQMGVGNVTPVLVVERMPRDLSWLALCKQLGIVLVWPEIFDKHFHG